MPSPHELAESFRKAPRRGDTLLAIDAMRVAHTGHLADVLGMNVARVTWVLHGHEPYYRRDRSLVPLGLVEKIAVRRGNAYAITELGHRVAASLRTLRAIDQRNRQVMLSHLRRGAQV